MTAPDRVPVKPPPPYATFVPSRGREFKTQFKTHNTLGQAKNAVLNRQSCYGRNGFEYDMVIYRLEGDTYIPLLKITKGTTRDDYPELSSKPPSKRQQEFKIRDAERAAQYWQEYAQQKAAEAAFLRIQLEEKK